MFRYNLLHAKGVPVVLGQFLSTSLGSQVPQGKAIVSMRTVANRLRTGFPISLREIVDILEPIKLTVQFDNAACAGSCEITMNSEGVVHYTGRVHDSGALAASYIVMTSFPTLTHPLELPTNVADLVGTLGPVVIAHKGHVGGTFSFDSRDSTWDKTATDPRIADNWYAVKVASRFPLTVFQTDTGVLEVLDGIVSGATGIFVFGL